MFALVLVGGVDRVLSFPGSNGFYHCWNTGKEVFLYFLSQEFDRVL